MNNKFVSMGSYRLSIVTEGKGAPSVVFETGLLADSDAWQPIAGEVTKFTRVLLYDRAGRGKSEQSPGYKTAESCASELKRLLQIINLPQPFLLVGQSFGGLIVRAFAAKWPEVVAGLILVDPTHEDQFDIISRALPSPSSKDTERLINFRQFWMEGYKDPQRNGEMIDFPTTISQIRKIKSYGEIPLWVMVAGSAFRNLGLDEEKARTLRSMMRQLHQKTVSMSAQGKIVIVENSDHFIQQDQPEAVIEVVRQAVHKFRERHTESRG